LNLPAHTQDDGFHEIQLNGKQLVFLFMAATVVSVVIFLCGVLVGRGVRAERGADAAALSAAAEPTPQALEPRPAPAPAGSDPTAAAAPPTVDDLSYTDRLEASKPSPERLKSPEQPARVAGARPAAAPAAAPRTATPPTAAPASTSAAATVNNEPPGTGYAVQIAALNVRSEADAIAKRLASKGYAAYVVSPASGTPQIYRVRIGKFESRRDAETMATKLEKEEQFKPWVTR
jgi:cell division septation protein DedD